MLVEFIKQACQFSKKIQTNKDLLDKKKTIIAEIEKKLAAINVTSNESENEFKKIQKDIISCEQEIQMLEDTEIKRKAQLLEESAAHTRKALEIEIIELSKSRSAKEQRLERLYGARERTSAEVQTKKNLLEQESQKLQLKLNSENEKTSSINTDYQAVLSQAEDFLKSIPESVKSRLSATGIDLSNFAVSPMQNGLCGNCFYPISSVDLNALNKKKVDLIDCKSCFKKIYIDTDVAN